MKIYKVTAKRINAHSNINKPGYCDTINVIGEVLCRSAVILGEPGHYEINDGSDELVRPVIYSDGKHEFISSQTANEHEKKILRGLATKYPRWISCTFSNGLNGVDIYELNELVKDVLNV